MPDSAEAVFTNKGREHLATGGRPWVDLTEAELFDEIGAVLILWCGHNRSVGDLDDVAREASGLFEDLVRSVYSEGFE